MTRTVQTFVSHVKADDLVWLDGRAKRVQSVGICDRSANGRQRQSLITFEDGTSRSVYAYGKVLTVPPAAPTERS